VILLHYDLQIVYPDLKVHIITNQ